jgi:hypothetical protein
MPRMRAECRAFVHQLERAFPQAIEAGCSFRVKSNPHDFGQYLEVQVRFDDDDEAPNSLGFHDRGRAARAMGRRSPGRAGCCRVSGRSSRGVLTMPTLIYEKTGQPVNVPDVIHSNGRAVIVCGWTEPRHPASTGLSRFKQWTNAKAAALEYFPHVFDCDWTGRTDR